MRMSISYAHEASGAFHTVLPTRGKFPISWGKFAGKLRKGEKYDNVVTCGENKHRQQESTYLITDTQMSF
jgi:hypothetical protein